LEISASLSSLCTWLRAQSIQLFSFLARRLDPSVRGSFLLVTGPPSWLRLLIGARESIDPFLWKPAEDYRGPPFPARQMRNPSPCGPIFSCLGHAGRLSAATVPFSSRARPNPQFSCAPFFPSPPPSLSDFLALSGNAGAARWDVFQSRHDYFLLTSTCFDDVDRAADPPKIVLCTTSLFFPSGVFFPLSPLR